MLAGKQGAVDGPRRASPFSLALRPEELALNEPQLAIAQFLPLHERMAVMAESGPTMTRKPSATARGSEAGPGLLGPHTPPWPTRREELFSVANTPLTKTVPYLAHPPIALGTQRKCAYRKAAVTWGLYPASILAPVCAPVLSRLSRQRLHIGAAEAPMVHRLALVLGDSA